MHYAGRQVNEQSSTDVLKRVLPTRAATTSLAAGAVLTPVVDAALFIAMRFEAMLLNFQVSEVAGCWDGEEVMLEKKETSGAPRNASLPPEIAGAAPGGPSTSAQPSTTSSASPAAGHSCLRYLIEIIKKRKNP
jgi:hypothetical protein